MEEEERSSDVKEKKVSVKKSIEALEDFARGIINCLSKRPEDKCNLCEEGAEDLKYSPNRCKDEVAALEALARKMLKWRRPDEALKRRKYAEGYDSLVEECQVVMKYHGLDVEYRAEYLPAQAQSDSD